MQQCRIALFVCLIGMLVACKQNESCRCASGDTPSSLECDSSGRCGGGFELVGHSDLLARGMNAGLAIAGNHAYVGSRTEGETHSNAGVLIVDISNPASPQVVGEIGPPDEGLLGISSRELRAVPDKNVLLVLDLECSPGAGDCSRDESRFPTTGGIAETNKLKIYDISNPRAPRRIGTYDFGYHPKSIGIAEPHEFFVWRDPMNPARVLVYVSLMLGPPSIEVIDITDPTTPLRVTTFDADIEIRDFYTSVHSVSVSPDGRTVYVASLGTGFYMLDATTVAIPGSTPELVFLTPPGQRVDYSPPFPAATHSAVKIPGRQMVLLTDEVYPTLPGGNLGCPWGFGRMVDITDVQFPRLFEELLEDGRIKTRGYLRLPENEPEFCEAPELEVNKAYTSHNPTVTEHVALITWHAAGLQAFDMNDGWTPVRVGSFVPDPLPSVALEDPFLGGVAIEAWSYPIVKDGLIYFVDVRNGLYVLRYTGPYSEEISSRAFLEGNSNIE